MKVGKTLGTLPNKIDTKMRRNFGQAFYEKGAWITLEYFKTKLIQEKAKFSSLDTYTPVKVELITSNPKPVLNFFGMDLKGFVEILQLSCF